VRRILRIWPLYYLLVIIGTLLVPFVIKSINYDYEIPYTFSEVSLYYLFFLPFCVNIIYGHHLLEPLWSIGVEEIFYIVWAPAIKFLKNNVLAVILSAIFIKLAFDMVVYLFELNGFIISALGTLQFHAMAVGGLGAYCIFNNVFNVSESRWFSLPTQIIVLLLLFSRFCFSNLLIGNSLFFRFLFETPIFSDLLLIVVFAWLIINVSLNSKSIIKLNTRLLNWGGEISYGIYMYHMLVVFGIMLFLRNLLSGFSPVISTVVFYILLTGGVIGISYLSKRFFEDYFLKLKSRF
jgi:peptidoglycan/LPS O-acetylase OafA/YrhL